MYDPKHVQNIKTIDIRPAWICIECTIQQQRFIILSLYLWNNDYSEQIEQLSHLLQEIQETQNIPTIIAGDYNARIKDKNQLEEYMIDLPN